MNKALLDDEYAPTNVVIAIMSGYGYFWYTLGSMFLESFW